MDVSCLGLGLGLGLGLVPNTCRPVRLVPHTSHKEFLT